MTDKKVPVYVGEGIDRIEVGRAGVETLSDGTTVVNISIESPDWGGWTIGGFFPLRLTGIIPINHLERRPSMPAAEDRQTKALQEIAQHNKELVKIFATMNENVVNMFRYIKEQIEKDEAVANDPNQLSIDELREKAVREEARRRTGEEVFTTHDDQLQYQKDAKDRDERREYEERTGETWVDQDGDQHSVKFRAPNEGAE
jgi:hypothetical protein